MFCAVPKSCDCGTTEAGAPELRGCFGCACSERARPASLQPCHARCSTAVGQSPGSGPGTLPRVTEKSGPQNQQLSGYRVSLPADPLVLPQGLVASLDYRRHDKDGTMHNARLLTDSRPSTVRLLCPKCRQYLLGSNWQLVQANSNRVVNGVGNCRSRGRSGRLADALGAIRAFLMY